MSLTPAFLAAVTTASNSGVTADRDFPFTQEDVLDQFPLPVWIKIESMLPTLPGRPDRGCANNVLYVKWGNDDERDFPDGVPTELTVLNSTSRADFEGWTVIQCDNAVVVHPSGAGGAGDALFWYGRPAWLIKREALNRDIEAGIEPGPGYVSQDGPTPDGLGGPTCFLGADGVWYRA